MEREHYCSWRWGYAAITLSEYFLLTGDESVLPAIRSLALSLAIGQDSGGLWGHTMAHTRGAPYHPQTQGKIERYHRTMKNVVKLQHYYFPWELEAALRDFVAYYNNERYHESLDNVTPADAYFGRQYEVLTERSKIKRRTMERRKKEYLAQKAA